MNIEFDFITPFFLGAKDIFEQLFHTKVNVSQINNIETDRTISDITVDLDIKSNNFTGKVYYFMSKDFVANAVKAMIGDMMTLDLESEMTRSALLELNNMVTGRALTKLADMGFQYNMGVPAILIGTGTQISEGNVSLSLVTLDTDITSFTIGFLTSSVEKLVKPQSTPAKVKTVESIKSVATPPPSSAQEFSLNGVATDNKSLLSQIAEITLTSINEIKDLKGDPEVMLKKGDILTKISLNLLQSNHITDHGDNMVVMKELKGAISTTLDELKVLKGSPEFTLKKNVIVAELAKVMLDVLLEMVS